jgi:hypothetical protein
MLEHPGEQFDVAPFIHHRCKASVEEVQAAIDGLFSPWQAEKLKGASINAITRKELAVQAHRHLHQRSKRCLTGMRTPHFTAI